mgnify:CR=1 FL=1
MVYCQECGTKNVDDSQFCYKCGAKIIKSNFENVKSAEINEMEKTEKSSVWKDFISMLDFSAIGKGLAIGLIIGIFTAGFIGIFVGGIITGYYAINKKIKELVINGWVLGFISIIIWTIIAQIFQSAFIKGYLETANVFGSTGLVLMAITIGALIGSILIGLIGSIGALIGSKISKKKKYDNSF